MWSFDRHAWTAIEDLESGELLQGETGPVAVVSVSLLEARASVYNLEIHGEHVYQIGVDGVVVHNSCLRNNLQSRNIGPLAKGEQAAHIVPTGRFSNRSVRVQQAIKTAQMNFDKYLGAGYRNRSINGFFTRNNRHLGTHTDNYFIALGKEFDKVASRRDALEALQRIRSRIQIGEFL